MASSKASNRPVPTKLSTLKVTSSAGSLGAVGAAAMKSAFAGGIHVLSGSGVPGSIGQVTGDIYIRTDTLSTSNQRIYTWNGTAWTAVL